MSQAYTRCPRNRLWYFISLFCVIALGLASRRVHWLFPAMLGKYPGDALWALMVFVGCGMLRPASSTTRLALCALGVSFFVEFFKLYQSPWIDSLRDTPLGHLILGYAFSWGNLLAYAVGVAIGALAERAAGVSRSAVS